MIKSFSDKNTELFFKTGKTKKSAGWKMLAERAARKLDLIEYAVDLEDLRSPPSNRLEKLRGDLDGFHSIRINDQWRIIFIWNGGHASEVAIVDYH